MDIVSGEAQVVAAADSCSLRAGRPVKLVAIPHDRQALLNRASQFLWIAARGLDMDGTLAAGPIHNLLRQQQFCR